MSILEIFAKYPDGQNTFVQASWYNGLLEVEVAGKTVETVKMPKPALTKGFYLPDGISISREESNALMAGAGRFIRVSADEDGETRYFLHTKI